MLFGTINNNDSFNMS